MRLQKYFKILCTIAVLFFFVGCDSYSFSPRPVETATVHRDDAQKIDEAFRDHQSNLFVGSKGQVVKILSDDLKGSRHQRFILRLAQGQTVLISHNIDVAPRIEHLKVGDEVYFYGEYVWNDQGGIIHWTHHDPQYRRLGGWLEHQGLRYE